MTQTSSTPATFGNAMVRPATPKFFWLVAQLVLVGVVVHLYGIEGPAFSKLYTLAALGFIASVFLPGNWRLPFFVILSLIAVFLVFGLIDGAWLVACGLTLIGLCHLPVPMSARVAALLLVGGLLAASRAGTIASPWSEVVWPILGSMFMFRLVLYMRALKSETKPGRIWAALGYFFMFPNLVFPLFPVIDYQTFRRTHFDRNEFDIYQQGLAWIARGLVHLVLYRLVYYQLLNDPLDVVRLGDLVQYMLGTFLLYLRVSGMFHLIVGMLHLFGFRLPETNRLYILSHSFTELWRRINIYWKDFMMLAVFYPVYFQVKRWGPAVSIGMATATVFVVTWILHSYQWFWLRGGFPIMATDILFWGLLGGLVVIGALRELRPGPKSRQKTAGWSLHAGLKTAATFSMFCFLWSLWSAESIGQWVWTLGAAARVDYTGLVLLGLVLATLVLAGGRNWDTPAAVPKWLQFSLRPAIRATTTLLALILLGQPLLQGMVPGRLAASLAALRETGLNVRDAALQHRGYYEQLDLRGTATASVLEGPGARRDEWNDLSTTGVLAIRSDFLERDLLPSRSVIWNGLSFSTNQWGMRDREYSREKPSGTLRIALLGPSHAMGNGVADGETFESLVEARLNRNLRLAGYERFEILNFAVDGYCLTQQLAILEDRVLDFSPDIVIATNYRENQVMTRQFLAKIVWRGIEVPYQGLRDKMDRAGLSDIDRGSVPVPFESWRRAVRWLGLDPRMPHGESESRIHWIADDVSAWTVGRFAEVTRSRGIRPVVLALDSVLDKETGVLPDESAILAAALPVIDLLKIFPEGRRASLRVAPWDDHPNAAGHALIADKLYPKLEEYLKREFGNI